MTGRWLKRFLVLVIFLSFAGCVAPAATSEPEPAIVFMEGYKPQANLPFVGVYVAQEKGFFAEEKVKVTIQHSPGTGQHLQLTVAGKVDVTTQDAAVLLKRRADPGLPLVAFALIGQKGQQAFAALASSGMRTPADWVGHTVGYKGTVSPELLAMLAKHGIQENQLDIVNVGFDPRLLSEGVVDLYPLFKSNEPYLLKKWGFELTMWDPADDGIPTLGLTYVTSDATLAAKPEALTRFLRAALKGIQYAEQHTDEAVGIVMKYAGPETDPDHMRFMLETELKDLHVGTAKEGGAGWQTLDQWQALAAYLEQYDSMKPIDPATAFTTSILEKVKE